MRLKKNDFVLFLPHLFLENLPVWNSVCVQKLFKWLVFEFYQCAGKSLCLLSCFFSSALTALLQL